MIQQGQVFKLSSAARDGRELWAYRYRSAGRAAKRIQQSGFASEHDARAALERQLEKIRRRNGVARTLTLNEFADRYLAQHEAAPVTLEKLSWLLQKAVVSFGSYRLDELGAEEIA